MHQNEIELQIWEYIDGICDDNARQEVEKMMATDAQYKELYEQLAALHKSVTAHIEGEEPHLRFTKNVMEAIAGATAARTAGKYINTMVVKLIAGFFIVSLLVTVVYAIAKPSVPTVATVQISLPKLDAGILSTDSVFNILTWMNVLTGLLLLDAFLRRKKATVS